VIDVAAQNVGTLIEIMPSPSQNRNFEVKFGNNILLLGPKIKQQNTPHALKNLQKNNQLKCLGCGIDVYPYTHHLSGKLGCWFAHKYGLEEDP